MISYFNSFQSSVNCEWDNWVVGECSKICGGGERTNTRDKKTREAHGGLECSGSATITEQCNIQECPSKRYKNFSILTYFWS